MPKQTAEDLKAQDRKPNIETTNTANTERYISDPTIVCSSQLNAECLVEKQKYTICSSFQQCNFYTAML